MKVDARLEELSSRWEFRMGKRHRRKFTDEFKAETVKLIRKSGRTVSSVSKELSLTETAVRNWVTCHGAFINVCPPMGLFRLVQPDREKSNRISCLMAERRQPSKMTALRAALVRQLTESFGCTRYHLYTGHPLLRRVES